MTEATQSPDTARSEPPRLPMMLWVAHWELLIVSVVLVAIFASRQTGALPGQTIRIIDVVFVAAALVLAMHAARVTGRTRRRSRDRRRDLDRRRGRRGDGWLGASPGSRQRDQCLRARRGVLLVLRLVLREERVTGDTLFGALAAYLAAAVLFAMVYTVIARSSPGAFEPPQPVIDGQSDLYYFSFVTITTLGYGDVAPASDLTSILAPIEAVLGAILLAALVGRIVGLLVAQTSESDTQARLDALTRAVERLEPDSPNSGTNPERDRTRPRIRCRIGRIR